MLEQENCNAKLTWPTRELAEAAAAYAVWQYGEDKSKARAYNCRECGKWHLARGNELD